VTAAGRYLRTIRRLTPGQLVWRVAHEVRYRAYRTAPWFFAACYPEPTGVRPAPLATSAPPAELLPRERAIAARWAAGKAACLGEEVDRFDWSGDGRSRLWRYERQYHTELVALAALHRVEPQGEWLGEARALLRAWRAGHPAPRGEAWEPYPVSRRILAWALSMAVAPELRAELAPFLLQHLQFLEGHLERHLLGNHLVCNGAALVSGAAALEGERAATAHGRGVSVLMAELRRQVLDDGGHLERSAHYHALVLWDCLLALAMSRLARRPAPPPLEEPLRRMLRWLRAVRSGSSLPMLNDAVQDGHPPVDEILALGSALGLGAGPERGWVAEALVGGLGAPTEAGAAPSGTECVVLDATGWAICRRGGEALLFDYGPLGPDEQPGHGHSDALGFELGWGGSPLVVDTGVSTYDDGPVRSHERSARAHACITVDDQGPDELWGAFRVGARGQVSGSAGARLEADWWTVRGTLSAPAGWTHRRQMAYRPGKALLVLDRVIGAQGRRVASRIPLAPGVAWDGSALASQGRRIQLQVLEGAGSPRVEEGWVADGWGRRTPRCVLAVDAAPNGCVRYAMVEQGLRVDGDGPLHRLWTASGAEPIPVPAP